MTDSKVLAEKFRAISDIMDKNCDYLVELDRQNGDGDLGLSMSSGFKATAEGLEASTEADLGKTMMLASKIFNEKSPSSLGTILSIGMMGMAKSLKGKTEANDAEIADALEAGLAKLEEKTGSSEGEKTIIDALAPAIKVLKDGGDYQAAAKAAADGSEATKQMLAKHGRAAYYGEKSIGILDGGSVVGKLIFEAIA